MRRIAIAAALAALMLSAGGPPASAATGSWQLAQPSPPPAPNGVSAVGRPLGLGQVGDIEFWAPNRGLLITGGNPPTIPAGVWAYNGANWHLLSTVCGSGDGRIAWAGPDEFWTISDPAPNSAEPDEIADTLCHFVNGAVVASYATPLGSADPYVQMSAAACNGPADCWFGGTHAASPLTGAFHLQWDGTTLTDFLGPQDRTIEGLAALDGQFFESVRVDGETDAPVPQETDPVLLHRIVEGETPDQTFVDEPFTPIADPGAEASLTLGTDGNELWAVGGSSDAGQQTQPPPLAARYVDGNFEQLSLDLTQCNCSIPAGDTFGGVAPEPGAGDAWVTVRPVLNTAAAPQAVQIADDGTVLQSDTLPEVGGGNSYAAGPIACPAVNDCWMVTENGWLYHYTDGTAYQEDTDPNFAGVISQRPPDAGTATFYPDTSPLDDSLANQQTVTIPANTTPTTTTTTSKTKQLVTHMHEQLHGMTLVLSFTLTVRARVSLDGLRGKRTVASSGTHVFAAGKRVLDLHLNRHAWPTKLKFNVTQVSAKPKSKAKAADTESHAPRFLGWAGFTW